MTPSQRFLLVLPLLGTACTGTVNGTPHCQYADGRAVLDGRCGACHSASVVGAARNGAPDGVDFDTDDDVRRWNTRIRQRALVDRTMPIGAPLPECEAALLEKFLTERPCVPACDGKA
jgi:uncharacterized membrane protein